MIDYSIHYRRFHQFDADAYDKLARHYSTLLSRSLADVPHDVKVLDYGCGAGFLLKFLSSRYPNSRGVDASPQLTTIAKGIGLDVELVTESEFPQWCSENTDTFDIIFLFDVLEHIPVPGQIEFLRTLVRTLRNGGQIFIKVPNANSLLASRWRYIDWTHHSSFTECSLDFVCANSGLSSIEYLADDSSLVPRYLWIPRWSLRRYYIRSVLRSLYRFYLWTELGDQIQNITVGYNLLIRATKCPK